MSEIVRRWGIRRVPIRAGLTPNPRPWPATEIIRAWIISDLARRR
jgi:hypothetical protein